MYRILRANVDKTKNTQFYSETVNFPKRYLVTFLVFLANLMEGYVMGNMSVIIVDITSVKRSVHENGTEIITKAEFDWTSMERGLVLGMNSLGQIVACFSGLLIHKFGGATFMGVGKLGEAIVSLTSPFVMCVDVRLFIAHRFVLGLFEGLTYIGIVDVFTHWAPPRQRVRLLTLACLGNGVGIATNYPVSGFIIQNYCWQMLFYLSGTLILIWSVVWIVFVSNDPSTDRFISKKERAFLSREMNHISKEKVPTPYRDMLTSVPVYALLNEFFISAFTGSFMNLTPLYIKDAYNLDIQTIGVISGIPECSALIVRPFFGFFIDYLRSKPDGYGVGRLHKIILFWGQSLTLVFFFAIALWNSIVGCITCLTLARISFSLSTVSYYVIIIDVAGQHAGFLQSIAQVFRSATFFLNPLLIGILIPNHIQTEWNVYFVVISCLTMYGVIVFIIFGSGDLQPWAKVSPRKNSVASNCYDTHL